MSKFNKKLVILFFIAFAALYAIIYIIPKVTGALVSSYTVEYGDLVMSDDTEGYFVRNEKVYVAASGGKANRYINGGVLIRKGTNVMEVAGGSDKEINDKYTGILEKLGDYAISTNDYAVAEGGVVSYFVDGYEGKLTPDTMEKGSLEFYSKLSQDNVVDLKRKNVAKGEPVFKIVDRTHWYIVCFVDSKHGDRYQIGDEINVEFEDDYVRAEVYKIKEGKDKTRIILETDYYYDDFDKTRVGNISLVTSDVKGLIIYNSSIATVKGEKGVYVKNKTNDYNFVPIQVYSTDGEKSVIADSYFYDEDGNQFTTIETYDVILKNPKK